MNDSNRRVNKEKQTCKHANLETVIWKSQPLGWLIEKVHPGDVIRFAPGEKHWHGAAPETAVTHIAIQEALNGKVVDWLEQVSDKQYQTGDE